MLMSVLFLQCFTRVEWSFVCLTLLLEGIKSLGQILCLSELFFLQWLLPETYRHWLRVLGYHSDVRQKQLFHLLCKPFLWSKHAVIHAEVRTVFQPEIWLSLAWAAFSSTDCYLYFQSVIPGSFRSVLFPLCVEFIGFGKRSFSIAVACASLFRNSRLLVVRDTCRDSERNNFQLAKMPVLVPGSSAGTGDFSAVSVPLCSLHPHLRIRGYLDFFPSLAFEGFEGLSASPSCWFLCEWERKWRGLQLILVCQVSDFPVGFEGIGTGWIWSWEMPGPQVANEERKICF